MASKDLEIEVESFYKFYAENYKTFEQAAEYYRSLLNSLISDEYSVQSITYRIKDKEECCSKFRRKYLQRIEEQDHSYEIKDHITDLIGLRVVSLYEIEINGIRKILEENFKVLEITDKIKSLDSTDDQFGYKSLHLDLKLNEERKKLPEFKKFADLRFEVQIRTIIQDAWSVLDHKIKYKKSVPPDLKRRINRLAALFEIADDEFYSIRLSTTDFEEKTKKETKPDEPLNVLTFLTEASKKFPKYQFISYKADGFVHDILHHKPSLTLKDFKDALDKNIVLLTKYNNDLIQKSVAYYLNPYTMIRHCLYLFNRTEFKDILFEVQRNAFEGWLEKNLSL